MIAMSLFDRLPSRIPMHFGASGAPDRWAALTYVNWMILPLTAVGLTALICLPAFFFDRLANRPDLINLPRNQKAIFNALTVQQRKPVLQVFEAYMCLLSLTTNLLFGFIHFETYRVALGQAQAGRFTSALLVFLAVIAMGTIWLFRYLPRLLKKLSAELPGERL